MILQGTVLPDEMTVADAVEALVRELRLPDTSVSGKRLHYRLDLPKYGQCPPGATLREAGVSNGDRVHLVAVERPIRRQSASAAGRPAAVASAGGIDVQIMLLDRNHVESTRLDPFRPAGELVRQIVEGYGLPRRDELDEPVTYRIESKALGRYIADRETLGSAGVPPGDRLVLHRQEHAG